MPLSYRVLPFALAALLGPFGLPAWADGAADWPSPGASTAGPMRPAPDAWQKADDARRLLDAYRRRVAAIQVLAEAGDVNAQYQLGVLFARGPGVAGYDEFTIERARAMGWLRVAADHGHINAAYELGRECVRLSRMSEAMTWFQKAADRGHVAAMSTLGVAYADGQWVPQDPAMAYMWLSLAVLRGSHDDLTELEATMTQDEITVAEARIWEWRRQHPKEAAPLVGGSNGRGNGLRAPRNPPGQSASGTQLYRSP